MVTATPEPVGAVLSSTKSLFERVVTYIKTDAHRVIAYVVTEAGALFTLAHVSATSLEHEITVAGAAAIAALINKARSEHILP